MVLFKNAADMEEAGTKETNIFWWRGAIPTFCSSEILNLRLWKAHWSEDDTMDAEDEGKLKAAVLLDLQ
jgi:hypothetical protein